MVVMLSSKFFSNNRRQLLKLVKSDGLIVVTANGLMQRSADTAFPFRQDSNFFYLTGLNQPNVVLVIDTSSGDECLILPKQTDVERFFGGVINHEALKAASGIRTVYEHKQGWDRFRILQQNRKRIYTLQAYPIQFTRQERMFTSPARKLLKQKLKSVLNLPHEYIGEQLIQLRSVKQPAEVEAIKQAITVTGAGIGRLKKQIRADVYEYELEAELDYEFKKRGSRHGFLPPIVAAGKNTTVLHYHANSNQLQSEDLLLLDIGAEVENYASDISRTYKVAGGFTKREQAVYDAVRSVHRQVLGQLKPGLGWREFVIGVDEIMGEHLLELGLITENRRQAVRAFFPHSIGHSLGLDVHDPCDYQKPLQAGMVLAIEPGIYIPEEGIGVRIEDNVLITEDGAVNLSADIAY